MAAIWGPLGQGGIGTTGGLDVSVAIRDRPRGPSSCYGAVKPAVVYAATGARTQLATLPNCTAAPVEVGDCRYGLTTVAVASSSGLTTTGSGSD